MTTNRAMARRSIRMLDRIEQQLQNESARWEDEDEYFRRSLEHLAETVATTRDEIDETYPGRKRKGGTA